MFGQGGKKAFDFILRSSIVAHSEIVIFLTLFLLLGCYLLSLKVLWSTKSAKGMLKNVICGHSCLMSCPSPSSILIAGLLCHCGYFFICL